MMHHESRNWITLDYLEFFCDRNRLLVHCHESGDELWISALGSHPSHLSADEIGEILRRSRHFEIRGFQEEESVEEPESYVLTRLEMEDRIRRMMQ